MNADTTPNRPPASVVVVSYNTSAYIEACLLSLLDLDYPQLEVIVVDNASTDGSVELVRGRFPGVELVEMPDNRGFAGGASVGLYMAGGEIVATINPDVALDRGWLNAVVGTLMSDREVGVVGSKILYPDRKTIQHAGGVVHYPLATTDHTGRGKHDDGSFDHVTDEPFVTGAALAMRREAGRDLRFFDESFYPMYYEDVDLCWRARAEGMRVVYQPKAVAYHEESVTMDRRGSLYYTYYHANRLRFVVKHYSPEQVMLDFLPAEAARVAGDMPAEDRAASLSLLDNRHAEDKQGSLQAPTEGRWKALDGHVSEVMAGWRVREVPFKSSAPVVGGLVAGLRERLANISTRWYVRPILQQQVDYNASVARTLREITAQLEELQARVAVQSLLSAGLIAGQRRDLVEDISTELETLRVRLEQMEGQSDITTAH